MNKMNFLTELPYDNINVFLNSFQTDFYTQEFKSNSYFSRVFDLFFDEEKNTKFRLEMSFSSDEDNSLFLNFDFKVFYKNACNDDFESWFIFKNFEKFKALTFLLEEQIQNYLECCELYKIDAIFSESISEKINSIGMIELDNLNLLHNKSKLFMKFIDTGIENEDAENYFPEKFMNNSFNSEASFSKEELQEATNIFNSISETIKTKFLDKIKPASDGNTNYKEELQDEETTEVFLEQLKPSRETLMELIDETLEKGDIDNFMRYTEMLKEY